MNSTTNTTRAAVAPAPTIHDVQVKVLELISLLETLDDMTGEACPDFGHQMEYKSAIRLMNLTSIGVQFARSIDASIDGFIRGRMA